MGRVYLAFDAHLERWVAVKESHGRAEHAAALREEAKLAASLDHPGVVAIHELVDDAASGPFYTMRLVRGRTLAAVLADTPDWRARARLLTHFRDACHAVAYAHAQGVLHRDIKPANILIGEFGETQVIDWGLAVRATDAQGGPVVGSPAWLAPEQARGEAATRASDVWGLGATLYHLLSGLPPFPQAESMSALEAARAAQVRPIGALAPAVPADLRAVVDKALAPAPADRYPDAAALAADIERYLTGDRVEAHPYTPLELLRRLAWAWRLPLGVAAVALVVLLAGALWSARRLANERDRAVAAEAVAEGALGESLASEARQWLVGGRPGVAAVVGVRALRLREDPEARGAVLGALSGWPVRKVASAPLGDCPQAVLAEGGWVCWNEAEIWRVRAGVERWRTPVAAIDVAVSGPWVAAQQVRSAAVLRDEDGAPAGTLVRRSAMPLLGTSDGRFGTRRWEGESWSITADLALTTAHQGCAEHGLPRESALHPTLPWHASWCADGTVAFTQGASPPVLFSTGLEVAEHGDAAMIAFSPTAPTLAIGYHRGAILLLDLERGETRLAGTPGNVPVAELAWSPDGALLALRLEGGGVSIWAEKPLAQVAALPSLAHRALAWEGPSRLRTVAQAVETWEIARRASPPVLPDSLGLSGLSFLADGSRLLTSHSDGVLAGWPMIEGAGSFRRVVGLGTVMSARPLATGGLVVATGEDHAVRWLDRDGRPSGPPITWGSRLVRPLGPDRALALSFDDTARLILRSGETRPVDCPIQPWHADSASADGATVLVLGADGAPRLFAGERCLDPVPGVRATRAALASDGGSLFAAHGEALTRHTLAGERLWTAKLPADDALHIAASPDGRWLATGGLDQAVRLWDAANGRLVATLRGHTRRVSGLAFSPDGRQLASASWDTTARLWSLEHLATPAAELSAEVEALGWWVADAPAAPGQR